MAAASLPLTALLLLIITIKFQTGECLTTTTTTTRIADFLPDDDEFLMESESNRRILQAARRITPDAQYKLPYCNRNVYGSCIGRDGKFYQRPCQYFNYCKK
ncbi:hypothetical protein CASFOL_026695 [Castilleja foliolosa]|uniref:Uncharacterized protein n=1 Tax=Castilleja foliolosa TaxID=1961234 RepID=A0ABD3CHS8_9LAMI